MPENALVLDLYDLQMEVGEFAGFRMGARFGDTAWTTLQQSRIDRSVNSGLRNVYFTQEMEGIPGGYSWSFLKPTSDIVLPQGATVVPLPDDFNGIQGDIIPASTVGQIQFRIRVVNADSIYRSRANGPIQTGRPLIAYIEPIKGTSATKSNRYQMQLWPTLDAEYIAQVWYEVAPQALTAALPFVYGGAPMAETFKAAVRAAYAETFEPGSPTTMAVVAKFQERLRASIAADRKYMPVKIGKNLDYSDDYPTARALSHDRWGVPMEINGVTIP